MPVGKPQDRTGPSIAVAGCGNRQVASDAVGPAVIEGLKDRCGRSIALFDVGTSALGLLDCLKSQDLLLVVDACSLGGAAGDIHVLEPDLDAAAVGGGGLHQIGPLEALMAARLLYPENLPDSLLLILAETGGLGEEELAALCRRIVFIIEREIIRRSGLS
jgi:hydrogenase maturation protease